MPPSWILNNYTSKRPSSRSPLGKVSEAPVDTDQWINFDFSLALGVYKLEVVSSEAKFFNYFTAGLIDIPYQVEPTHPDKRFGEAYGIVADIQITPGEGVKKSGGAFTGGMDLRSLSFRLAEKDCLRIESWAQHPTRSNPAALPPEYSYFPHVWRRRDYSEGILKGAVGIARTTSLEKTFPSVSRLSYDGEFAIFGAEDGEDSDFNDLIVRLSRIGD